MNALIIPHLRSSVNIQLQTNNYPLNSKNELRVKQKENITKINVPGQKDPIQRKKVYRLPKGTSPAKVAQMVQNAADLFEEEKKKEILGNKYLMKNPDITFIGIQTVARRA